MRVIIAGGRDYTFDHEDIEFLENLYLAQPFTVVLSGGATGADAEGEWWAKYRGIPVERYPADWAGKGRAAGPIRNAEMVRRADALIAFPGGRGTADVTRRARSAGLQVWEVER